MNATRRRIASGGLLAAVLLVGLLAIATPVFAGSTGSRASRPGPTANLALAINAGRRRQPAPPAGGALSATPLRHGSGNASRPGATASLAVVLATPGRSVPRTPGPAASAPKPQLPAHRPRRTTRTAATAAQLRAIAASPKHPIYWAGTAGGTYELTTVAATATYIRYLPRGVPVGSPHGYLTIGTLKRPSAPYEAARRTALAQRSVIRTLKGGGLAIQYKSTPHNVYLVFPYSRYEVQIYDPSPGKALSLATSGKIIRIS